MNPRANWASASTVVMVAGAGFLILGSASFGQQQPRAAAAAERAASVAEGEKLFKRQWEPARLDSSSGDGLGPMFNHTSCVACHKQGGMGGGGAADVNALMVSVIPPAFQSAAKKQEFLNAVKRVHPGFVTADNQFVPNVILHRFSTDGRYGEMRARLAGADLPINPAPEQAAEAQERLTLSPVRWVAAARPLQVAVTERNAPAMFGAGLIDAIPEATLHAIAAAQRGHKEISGRVAPVNVAKAGRFGWRGQTERLADFVQGACANELGLEVPTNAQPANPLQPDQKAPGVDLLQTQCNDLIAFVRALPPPKFERPADPDKLDVVDRGYTLFHQIGCSTCHVENVAPAKSVFSDFLLHDMGQALGDPVVAQPTHVPVDVNQTTKQALAEQLQQEKPKSIHQMTPQTYYGGLQPPQVTGMTFVSDSGQVISFRIMPRVGLVKVKFAPAPTNLAQEWKTPPLWGVADSAPYLHDGRAETLLDAIVLHGGEAKECTERFLALPAGDRMAILEFLGCLKAPDSGETDAEAPDVAVR